MQVTFVYQGIWYLMPATGEDFLTYTAQGRYIESSTGDKVQVCAVCVTDDFVQRMASILSSGQPPENVLEIVTIRAIFNKTMQCYFKMSGTNGHIPFKDIIVPAGLSGDLLLELSFKDNYIKNIFKSR